MEIKIRYKSFSQFRSLNEDKFAQVFNATKSLKSHEDLALTGDALIEAEKLAFTFLRLRNTVSDLCFGLSASALDAKHDCKVQKALAYRNSELKSQGDKVQTIEAVQNVIDATQTYNDLVDLKEYLDQKYSDFETSHYYYKNIAQGRS